VFFIRGIGNNKTVAGAQAIEKRLGRPVAPLAEDMSLPPDIAARIGRAEGGAAAYGQAPGNAARAAELSAHQAQVAFLDGRPL